MAGIKERVKRAENQRIAAQEELAKMNEKDLHSTTILPWLRRKAESGLVRDLNKKKNKKQKKK